jgi:hypothetical protein
VLKRDMTCEKCLHSLINDHWEVCKAGPLQRILPPVRWCGEGAWRDPVTSELIGWGEWAQPQEKPDVQAR